MDERDSASHCSEYIIAKVALPWQLDQTPNDESLAQGGTSPNWRLCHRGKQE